VRRGLVGVALIAVMLLLALAGVVWTGSGGERATSGVLTAPTRDVLPGRDASFGVDLAGWRVVGVVVEDASGSRYVLPLSNPTQAPEPTATSTPTMTPSNTPFPTTTSRPTDTTTPTATPSATPSAIAPQEPTPTPEDACVVRSTANVWARTLPVVRSDTGIGVLPADSPVRITGYTVEQVDANTSYIWYRYWFDVEHPEAWSRADFFTERDDTPGCQLLPRVTEP